MTSMPEVHPMLFMFTSQAKEALFRDAENFAKKLFSKDFNFYLAGTPVNAVCANSYLEIIETPHGQQTSFKKEHEDQDRYLIVEDASGGNMVEVAKESGVTICTIEPVIEFLGMPRAGYRAMI